MNLELIKTKENGIDYLVHPAGSIFAGMKIRETRMRPLKMQLKKE